MLGWQPVVGLYVPVDADVPAQLVDTVGHRSGRLRGVEQVVGDPYTVYPCDPDACVVVADSVDSDPPVNQRASAYVTDVASFWHERMGPPLPSLGLPPWINDGVLFLGWSQGGWTPQGRFGDVPARLRTYFGV
jgi:hypothetical protein